MRVLGIETSCDDTAVCLLQAEGSFGSDPDANVGAGFKFRILGNALSSQATLHAQYGGVFPNVAKREHLKNLPILLQQVQKETAGVKPDVIAVTLGPGLEPCLWTGITFVQKLAEELRVPIVAVNHLEGHIIMSMMNIKESQEHSSILQNTRMMGTIAEFEFPILALLISGGNTQLVLSKEPLQYEAVGKTRDDAAGEAFDKVARMMELPYPGGPHIAALAKQAREENLSADIKLPRPMLNEDNLDFSFSGLKSAVLRFIESQHQGPSLKNSPRTVLGAEVKMQLAREFEEAVADVLVGKTLRAVEEYGASTVVTGGGVSANTFIRKRLTDALAEAGAKLLVCPPEFSTDNAVMIALAGYFHALKKEFAEPTTLTASGNLTLDSG